MTGDSALSKARMAASVANPSETLAPLVAALAAPRSVPPTGHIITMQPAPMQTASRTHASSMFSRSSRSLATVPRAAMADTIKQTVQENKVFIASKTYCPYCSRAKGLFQKLGVPAKVWELDDMDKGDEIQSTLQGITGCRTVPQVFIGGKFIGGCDDTMKAYDAGELKQLLAGVGYSI